jgi:hypothetical protein
VCDSSWSISKFTTSLTPLDPRNAQIGDPALRNNEGGESGYEALFHINSAFYAVRESILDRATQSYHAAIKKSHLDPNQDQSYTIARLLFFSPGSKAKMQKICCQPQLRKRDTVNEK